MTRPIEGSEDKYTLGTPEHEAWLEGREAYCSGDYDHNPYHSDVLRRAWQDGIEDEKIWALDSTGR